MILDRKPPTPPDATYAEAYSDLCEDNRDLREEKRGLERKNGELKATIKKLTQEAADRTADTAAVTAGPEEIVALAVALAQVPNVEYNWVRDQLARGNIKGEKRGPRKGRWFTTVSAVRAAKRATFG
jgi:hypothetical protein